MNTYWADFLTMAVAHFLAVASPGPDMALILRQSVRHGRQVALLTSVGIGLGILVHVSYCILGVALLFQQNPLWMDTLQWAGAVYLMVVGWQSLRAPAPTAAETQGAVPSGAHGSAPAIAWQPVGTGFLTNVLNIKATLFFLALYTVVPAQGTPIGMLATYGIWMSLATAAWFAGLSLLLDHPRLAGPLQRYAIRVERVMGVVLILIGIQLLVSDLPLAS